MLINIQTKRMALYLLEFRKMNAQKMGFCAWKHNYLGQPPTPFISYHVVCIEPLSTTRPFKILVKLHQVPFIIEFK